MQPSFEFPRLAKEGAVRKLVPSAKADSILSNLPSRHIRAGLSHGAATRLACYSFQGV
ncbi:hypothetical protein SBA1_250011 [Candidatus Sulfotelmatobacter kueseliae]|uniref:Uncharacterized protein n=1 Tax=Candidatus Sulfotelmatobacter kueseliae TaxID=2042962 RepID=A0A2U3KI29_9BACT|nr:hypothetical protein SBA1_250011 [Candidatus Sulfotelmatobacter kueseliae]